jgi:hypothetical protein
MKTASIFLVFLSHLKMAKGCNTILLCWYRAMIYFSLPGNQLLSIWMTRIDLHEKMQLYVVANWLLLLSLVLRVHILVLTGCLDQGGSAVVLLRRFGVHQYLFLISFPIYLFLNFFIYFLKPNVKNLFVIGVRIIHCMT